MQLLPLLLLPVLMYFLLIRPQQKKMRDQQSMLGALAEGDEIMSTAGIYGFVTAIDDDVIWVEIAENVEIRLAKGAIAKRIVRADTTGATDAGATNGDDADDGGR